MSGENGKQHDFEGFTLDAEKKILWREGEIVALPPKAVEMLAVLLENRGEVVTKNELLEAVWGETFVEESVLTNNVYLLRKTLKDAAGVKNLIQTVPRRGYRFGSKTENDSGEFVLEHHVFEQTLVEEIPNEKIATPEQTKIAAPAQKMFSTAKVTAFFVILALLTGFGLWSYFSFGADGAPKIRSIAVLPLTPIAAPNDEAFGFGFADTLITNLGKFDEITILPVSTVAESKNIREPLEIAKNLGVDAVIEGTFQKANGKLRVALRLTRTSDGKQIWSEIFDYDETEIFEMQDAIAERAAAALALDLNLQNRDRAFKRYTENTDAYAAYQTGRFLYFQGEYEKAELEFKRSLESDKKYILAFTGLADVYWQRANRKRGETRIEFYEKAKNYALQALSLDENLAEAHSSLGWILRIYDWDWAESERHLKRAAELDPNSAINYQRLAYLYMTLGKTAEAVEFSKRAQTLNPVNHIVGWAYFCNRQYEESANAYSHRLNTASSKELLSDGIIGAAMAYSELGNQTEALRILENAAPEIKTGNKYNSILATVLFRAGQTEKAEEVLRIVEKADDSVRLANIYAVAGQKEKAIAALQKGFEKSDDRIMWLKTSPYYDNLRDDPRFREILQKMNLE